MQFIPSCDCLGTDKCKLTQSHRFSPIIAWDLLLLLLKRRNLIRKANFILYSCDRCWNRFIHRMRLPSDSYWRIRSLHWNNRIHCCYPRRLSQVRLIFGNNNWIEKWLSSWSEFLRLFHSRNRRSYIIVINWQRTKHTFTEIRLISIRRSMFFCADYPIDSCHFLLQLLSLLTLNQSNLLSISLYNHTAIIMILFIIITTIITTTTHTISLFSLTMITVHWISTLRHNTYILLAASTDMI